MDNTQMPQQKDNAKTFSVVALVCGILSIVGGFIPVVCYFTLVLGIVGIVFGVKGRKMSPAGKTGMATAGFVCAIIGTVFSVSGVLCALCVCGAANSVASSSFYY